MRIIFSEKINRIIAATALTAAFLFFIFQPAFAAPPTVAVKFVILDPSDSTVGVPVTVTIEAQKSNGQVDVNYQNDVTLVVGGSATGGGLVDIVNGVGTASVNDSVAETITLSLSDTQGTALDVSSAEQVVFFEAGSGLWSQTNFLFRDDDGTEISASGLGDPDAAKDISISLRDQNDFNRQKIFRLRIALRVQQIADSVQPRLEFKRGGGCADIQEWNIIGTSTGRYILRDSPNVANQTPTTQNVSAGSGFVSGLFLDTQNLAPAPLSLDKNQKTEYEWSLQDTAIDFTPNHVYYFRVTDNGEPLDLYNICPVIAFGPHTGGQPTEVQFSGRAYPGANVTIYQKAFGTDVPIKQSEINSADGSFDVSQIGIIQNVYNYSLIITDKEGRQSQVKSYNLDVYANALTAKDIFVPPTLGLVRAVVAKGDFLTALGFAGPNNDMEFEIDDRIAVGKTKANAEGSYKWLFNTAGLSFGSHRVRARQINSPGQKVIQKSDWSPTLTFTVSPLFTPKTDLNNDGIINISDWSIFLSRWHSPDETARKHIDLNGDSKVDISDFSIFIRTLKNQ